MSRLNDCHFQGTQGKTRDQTGLVKLKSSMNTLLFVDENIRFSKILFLVHDCTE